jgi:hypothetical protein
MAIRCEIFATVDSPRNASYAFIYTGLYISNWVDDPYDTTATRDRHGQPDLIAAGRESAQHARSHPLRGRVPRRLRRRAHSTTMDARSPAGGPARGASASGERVDDARPQARPILVPAPRAGLEDPPQQPRVRSPRRGRTARPGRGIAVPNRTSRPAVRDLRATQQPSRASRMGRDHTYTRARRPVPPHRRRPPRGTRPPAGLTASRRRAPIRPTLLVGVNLAAL